MVLSIFEFENTDILILVKTYPTPSSSYAEVVCTAGVTRNGEWIRIFPVPYRSMNAQQQYKVFSWINVEIAKSSDTRPESRKIKESSLIVSRTLDSTKDIEERNHYIELIENSSYDEIMQEYSSKHRTLGVFSPKEVIDIEIKQVSREWDAADITKLQQASLFDSTTTTKKILEKIPYEFRLKWRCNDPRCEGHTRMITEWEFMQAYRNYVRIYGSEREALRVLKEHYLDKFNRGDYKSYIFVGNMLRAQPTFLVIGHYWYPRKNRKTVPGQLSLNI